MNYKRFFIKQSRFNIYYTTDDGVKLAFNSLTCGLAIVDDTYNSLIQNLGGLTDKNVPANLRETYDAARSGRFVIEDDFDELLDLSTKRHIAQYGRDSISLTIAPTLACNFKCIYCYETSKQGIMPKNVQQEIVKFIEKQAETLKNFKISWYGGEPLLATDVIYNLSEKFLNICAKHNIKYSASIVSNGYLLTDDIIAKLIAYEVSSIQITIDGPPEIHDSRRINKNGESSFNIIVENINKLLAYNKITVSIRINVDKTNEMQIEELVSILSDRLINKKIRIYFGQVVSYTESCKSIENGCFDNLEFSKRQIKYYDILKKHGFFKYSKVPYPYPKLIYCCAARLNTFVVDHEGYLYKCWNEVGNISGAIGNITDCDFDMSSYKHGKWLMRNPIYDEKCIECDVLPICMGGCPYSAVVLKQKNKCDLVKYNIKDIMLNYYKNFQEE